MSELPPGSLCWLVNLTESPELIGRVVDIVGLITVPDDPGDWYEARAGWSEEELHTNAIHVRRGNLLLIAPPDLSPSAALKSNARQTEKEI